jgi:CDP-glycerol glycerophosphotransferase
LGIPEGKRVVLYAPTWRDDRHATAAGGFVHEITADLDRLRERLGEDHLILFRSHYLVAQSFDFSRHQGFVRDVSSVNDINDLYLVSDVLVTDYSSVFFDFANLRRPIIFYMYDLERFSAVVRGLYLDPSDLPGPIAQTEEELFEAILASESDNAAYDDRYRTFNERFNYLDDGAASKRVLERIMPPVSREASDQS